VRTKNKGVFLDFSYPGDETIYGILERAMPRAFKAAIRDRAKGIRDRFPEDKAWHLLCWQCDRMANAWLQELGSLKDLDPIMVGGIGVDFDRSGGPDTVAESLLSGYRKADGYIHWHYWLLIGPRRHVFDPTAHQEQFKREGPMKLDHYVIEGHPLPKWRRAVRTGPDPGV
jgi:hypothetical protein